MHADSESNWPGRRSQLRPPPNYFSRRVQLRLFLLVALFMVVLTLMGEARKPEHWRWLWLFDHREVGDRPSAGDAPEQIPDTRAPLTGERAAGSDLGIAVQSETGEMASPTAAWATRLDLDQIRTAGWQRWLDRAAAEPRQQLAGVLLAVRDGRTLTAEEMASVPLLLESMERSWEAFQNEQLRAATSGGRSLSDPDTQEYLARLTEAEAEWESLRETLRRLAAQQSLADDQPQQLAQLQAEVDAWSWRQVRDDAVFQAVERDAWFRAFDQLRRATPAELERQSQGERSFVQLYAQPAAYRGQLVTIAGEARLGYRVGAPRNVYGFESYYILWIKPADQGTTPFVVYCLDLPDGFPSLPLRQGEELGTPLREPIRVTGYFFKRWVYPSAGGPNTAPLLIAKVPEWQPATDRGGAAEPSPLTLPRLGTLATIALVAALVLTWAAWRATRQALPRRTPGTLGEPSPSWPSHPEENADEP